MKIIVTGATGFLGKNLCEHLKLEGHVITELNSKNCDLTKRDSLDQFSGTKYDLIYHLAVWTEAGDFCLYHPGEQWIVNQAINTNVLAWWQKNQSQAKLICMGTSCSYDPSLPHTEENYLIGTPTDSLFTYAMTKRMLYVGLLALQKQFGMKYLCLVPSTLYGPNYPLERHKQSHFIFDLIKKIARGKHFNEPVILWGDGYQKRELIYIQDFIQAMTILATTADSILVNIGGGAEYTIRDFAEMISKIIGYDANQIQYDTSKYVGAKAKFLITDKLKTIMPEFQNTSLEKGLTATVNWYLEKEIKPLLKN